MEEILCFALYRDFLLVFFCLLQIWGYPVGPTTRNIKCVTVKTLRKEFDVQVTVHRDKFLP